MEHDRDKELEMFEKSFQRPKDYFKLSERRQWIIDKDLGILDWEGKYLTKEDIIRFQNHYKENMHTFEGKTCKIHHNLNLDGELHINIDNIQKSEFDGNDFYTVKIDAKDVIDLVINKIKNDKISEIESMDNDEFVKKYL